jgi:hypothetical protein
MAKREKTDSITHLVKTVAGEVFDEKIKAVRETFVKDMLADQKEEVKRSASNAGESWSKEEDEALEVAVTLMVLKIAKKHGRTLGSIRCRIMDKMNYLY